MLQAGFARVDITPPLGTPMAGYFHKRCAKGVLDPLYANAVAITSGEETVILIALDALGIQESYTDTVRAAIEEKGLLGILSGPLTAASAGTAAALVFGFLAALISRGKLK